MSAPPLIGLRHVALRFRDLEAAEHFFTAMLGYRVAWRPDPDDVYLTSGEDNLALHRAPVGGGGESRLDHIGLFVARPEDVDAWARELERKGARLLVPPRTHRDGARSFYLAGPEGLSIQVLHTPAG